MLNLKTLILLPSTQDQFHQRIFRSPFCTLCWGWQGHWPWPSASPWTRLQSSWFMTQKRLSTLQNGRSICWSQQSFPWPIWAQSLALSSPLHFQFRQICSRTVWSDRGSALQCTCKLQHRLPESYHRLECHWSSWAVRGGIEPQQNYCCWRSPSPFPFRFGRSWRFPSLWRMWNHIWNSL